MIWPFVCIAVVVVAMALADFLFEPSDPSARALLLVVRLVAGASLVALAGITLRRLFAQRKELQDALAASEERFVGSLSDIPEAQAGRSAAVRGKGARAGRRWHRSRMPSSPSIRRAASNS